MIKLFDARNYTRFLFEHDVSGRAPRTVYETAKNDAPYTQFWIWDPPGGNDKRRQIYPDYKVKRGPTPYSVNESIKLTRNVLRCTHIYDIEVPGYEADDVIATLAKRAAKDTQVAIYANDYDYMALTDNPNIICGAKPKEGVKPEEVRLFKWCVGDSSDNIGGIQYFGRKTWDKLDHSALQRLADEIVSGRYLTAEDVQNIVPGLSASKAFWIVENRELMIAYWQVLGFFDVPYDLIEAHMARCEPNHEQAEETLRRWLL